MRVNLTLRKVPPGARDKFRALTTPDTYKEIRPGSVGERVAYSVEMTEAEFAQAQRDAEDPRSNLIDAERDGGGRSGSVPGGREIEYLGLQNLTSWGWDGSSIDVGIADSGLGAGLASGVFSGRIKAAKSEIETDPLTDPLGHGSKMAGLAVPPRARIVVSQVLTEHDEYANSELTKAIYWMIRDVGVHVINLSLYGDPSTVLLDALREAKAKNVLVFASFGNEGDQTPYYPASYPEVLGITSYDSRTDSRTPSSSYGQGVFAASTGMPVTWYLPGGAEETTEDGGTSAATALTSRMAASIMTRIKSPGTVKKYMANNARRTSAGPYHEGNGVLNAAAIINQIRQDRPEGENIDGTKTGTTEGCMV